MVSTLFIGPILTLLAWIGLMVAILHGKYVVDKIAVDEYEKGPFSSLNGGSRE